MVCGVSFEDMDARITRDPTGGVHTTELVRAITDPEFGRRVIYYVPSVMAEGRVFILSVPSLNHPGRSHNIVVDWQSYPDKPDEHCYILDPQYGNPGKLYYGHTEDGYQLVNYSEVIEVLLDE
jgi:hypothetical protein|tara:strand:+ start:1224 stop:1592 length:369 start_codon:yes stop_codon:yes gene_type:complete